MKTYMLCLALCGAALGADISVSPTAGGSTIKLNNGVLMPQMALGTWQYDNATAADAIKLAFEAGFTHVDTAEDYFNQVGVGNALKGKARDSFFLTTKSMPCSNVGSAPGTCRNQTISDFAKDLEDLQVDYVDLILLHGPSHRGEGKCDADVCAADAEQWAVYEEMYKQGKAKAIGVSNYCKSCFECLLDKATVVPAVNQFQWHVGMGDDPSGFVSYGKDKGIVSQAYSPLGDGKLVTDAALAAVGKAHGKSGAQVALKWLVDKGVAVVTKADNAEYLAQDIDMYSWELSADETAQLSANTMYPGDPSWACTE